MKKTRKMCHVLTIEEQEQGTLQNRECLTLEDGIKTHQTQKWGEKDPDKKVEEVNAETVL